MPDETFCQSHQLTPGRFTRISVRDTGIGMRAAVRRRVFDPFFTTKEKTRGTGLGLASAYGIFKNHDGTITVDSDNGAGARFDIYLPVSDQAARPATPSKARLATGLETILPVDDEKMILDVGRAMLERLG